MISGMVDVGPEGGGAETGDESGSGTEGAAARRRSVSGRGESPVRRGLQFPGLGQRQSRPSSFGLDMGRLGAVREMDAESGDSHSRGASFSEQSRQLGSAASPRTDATASVRRDRGRSSIYTSGTAAGLSMTVVTPLLTGPASQQAAATARELVSVAPTATARQTLNELADLHQNAALWIQREHPTTNESFWYNAQSKKSKWEQPKEVTRLAEFQSSVLRSWKRRSHPLRKVPYWVNR